jgi:hypothetical protein
MYIFTRRVLVNPAQTRKAMAFATSITEYINKKSDLGVSLYQVLQGAPQGTLSWAYRTESYAASLESVDELLRSDEYLKKVESGSENFIGNAEDRLGEIVHAAGQVDTPPPVASVVTASMEVSRAGAAVSWAIALADYVSNLGGIPMAVLTSNFGPYGTLSWISYAQSVAQVEEAGKKINVDPGYIQRLGESKDLFVSGSGVGMLSRKIA